MPCGTIQMGSIDMEDIRSLTSFMGGSTVVGSPRSEFEFIKIIRLGLPSKVITSVVKSSALSEEVICKSLRISKRTAARRKANSARLKASESELIFRFSRVMVTAKEILGDKDKAREWLLSENTALNGERPIDLLDTGIGFEDVMDVLRRIEFGVYS
jgi:putative toxin-antitoxin system antitoxin component (TIGR02293 family)